MRYWTKATEEVSFHYMVLGFEKGETTEEMGRMYW